MSERTVIVADELLTFATADPLPPVENETLRVRDDVVVGLRRDARVLVDDGLIVAVEDVEGPLPEGFEDARELRASVVMPAWVECHTHSLFAGSRSGDFWRRNLGVSYAEILESGGGIASTLAATREAPDEVLAQSLLQRLEAFHRQGIAAVEVKTGYGLSVEHELRHLRIIRDVAGRAPVDVVSTCLAGHMIPPERKANRERHIDDVVTAIIPEVARTGLAQQVDVFCDRGALTLDEAQAILEAGLDHGLALRAHSEQLSHTGATFMAAEMGARSADHLDFVNDEDIAEMATGDVAAGLLPLCTVFLDVAQRPPARKLVDAGVRIAVSTDFNPGSAHGQNLHLAATLACTLFKLTPGEALRGVTRVPAEILGLDMQLGTITPGRDAKLIGYDVAHWRDILWHMDPPAPRWMV